MGRLVVWMLCAGCSYTPSTGIGGDSQIPDTQLDGVTIPDASDAAGCIPVAFRASSSATTNSTTSVTVGTPAGVIQNDVMIAAVLYEADSDEQPGQLATPTGWTLLRRDELSINGGIGMSVFSRVAAATESANHTFTTGPSKRFIAVIQAYSGVDTASAIAIASQTSTSSTSIVAPNVTGATCGMLVGAFGVHAITTVQPPTSMTERAHLSNSNNASMTLEVSDELSTGGATGTRTALTSNAAQTIGQLVALTP